MKMLSLQIKKITLVVFLLSYAIGFTQINEEKVFNEAKTKAAEQKYHEAIQLINQLLIQNPKNLDYKLYLAQVNYWSNNFEISKKIASEIVSEKPEYQDAYDLLIKVYFAQENFSDVIQKAEEGKNKFPLNKDFYNLQQALAYEKMSNDTDALNTIMSIDTNSSFAKDAKYLETQILKKKKNNVAVGHLFSDFENSASAINITHLEYGRKINSNTFIGRINYGNSNNTNDFQGEIDAYLKVKSKSYLYLNSGFSANEKIFPQYKFGAEYYQDFKKISSSLGSRYLYFDSENKTLLFTGHLGLALNQWKIEYRHYLAETNSDWFSSSILNFRRNFEKTESFVQLDLQYGTLPYFFLNNASFQRLNAFRIGINNKIRIEKNYFIQPIVMLEREEFIPENYRNRFSLQFILTKRF